MSSKQGYRSWVLGIGLAAAGAAVAQQAAPEAAPTKRTAQLEAGEPRADTSGRTSAPPPAPAVPAVPAARSHGRGAAAQQPPAGNDHVELDTTTVTGNQELPKVMYIVPWKKSDIGDLAGKPMNSLLDEVLAPVDRDVFRREVRYYDAVKSDTAKNGAPAGVPAKQGEK